VVVPICGTGISSDRDRQREVVCGVFLGGSAAGDRRQRSPAARHRQERLVSTTQLHSGDWLGDLAVLGSSRGARAESVLIRFIFLLLLACSVQAETLTGRVVGVADGDTITVLDAGKRQHKIRLQGIDAPEKAQPFGQRSKENLSRLVFGKDVRVDWDKRDRYGRIVGKVWVQPESCPICPMTLDAGHAQITVGLAWWYRKYANEQLPQDSGAYEFSEQDARAKRAGLWSDPDPIPPWEWRRR